MGGILYRMLHIILPISVGAILGAVLRYYVSSWFNIVIFGFGWGIIICNIVGSFLMGVFVEAGESVWHISPSVRLWIATGFLGSFTTFSTFSLQAITVLRSGDIFGAVLYVLASVMISLFALYMGMVFVKIWQ